MTKKKPKFDKPLVHKEFTEEDHRKAIEDAYLKFKAASMAASALGYEVRIQKDDTIILVKVVGKVLKEEAK